MTSKVLRNGAFLHIPKTGGTWAYRVLDNAELTKGPIGHEHNWDHSEKWAFTFVRDPALWWLSLWKDRMDNKWTTFSGGESHCLYPIETFYEPDVELWLIRAAHEHKGFCGQVYMQFIKKATYIFQTEQMADRMAWLAKQVRWPKLDLTIPRLNESHQKVNLAALDLDPIREAEPVAMHIWNKAKFIADPEYSI